MRFRISIAALALVIAAGSPALAAPPVEEAFEVPPEALTLPANEFGSVILRPCEACKSVTLRVDGSTQYLYQRTPFPLKEFRALVLDLSGKEGIAVTVIYRLPDQRVARIFVSPPAG